MPRRLVKRIDTQTKLQGSSRSDFIRQAIQRQLVRLERWDGLTQEARRQHKGKPLSKTELAELVRKHRSA